MVSVSADRRNPPTVTGSTNVRVWITASTAALKTDLIVGDALSTGHVATVGDAGNTESVPLRGRALRFVLVDEIRERGGESMTVAEMVAVLADNGHDLGGRASKVISDALRWELARGRVRRLGRGVYRYHRTPASTARRIRIFAETCRTWLVVLTRTAQPGETSRGHRSGSAPGPQVDRGPQPSDSPKTLPRECPH